MIYSIVYVCVCVGLGRPQRHALVPPRTHHRKCGERYLFKLCKVEEWGVR